MHSCLTIKLSVLQKNEDVDISWAGPPPKSIQDFEDLLQKIDLVDVCMGGPFVKYYPDLDSECAYVDDTVCRHNRCSIVITIGICKKCFSLHETLKKIKLVKMFRSSA